MCSLQNNLILLIMTTAASLLGLATAAGPWDTPGVGHGSTSASYNFTMTVDGQNICGNDVDLGWDPSAKLPIEDCINLRDSHADSNLTGTYTYDWKTPGDVPAGTFIYGPYYGDCMLLWLPYDYTQSFTIGNQDIYDIVNTAIESGKQSWSMLACEGGSGQPLIVDWTVESIKANSGSPGPGPFGNIG